MFEFTSFDSQYPTFYKFGHVTGNAFGNHPINIFLGINSGKWNLLSIDFR
ncbi:hypothetical protein [Flagellimonas chongwuensis]|nr:hypothetical protein [Allomuricauda chongwuensis]